MAGVAGEFPAPLRDRNTWTLREIGGARHLLSGDWPRQPLPWVDVALRGAGLLALALAVLAVARRTAASWRTVTARTPVLVYLAAYIALINILWFYNDRYALVLLPLLVVVALTGDGGERRPPRLAWALTAVFAVIACRRGARHAPLQPGGARHLAVAGRQRRAAGRHRRRLCVERVGAVRPSRESGAGADDRRRAVGDVEAGAALSPGQEARWTATTKSAWSSGTTTSGGRGRIACWCCASRRHPPRRRSAGCAAHYRRPSTTYSAESARTNV